MKTVKHIVSTAALLAVLSLILSSSGCKESTTESGPTVQPITEDLFPLIVGRKLTFSGFLRDRVTDINIDATGAVYEARMTVAALSVPTPFGTAHVVSDSQRVPTGIATPPTIWVLSTFYVQRPSPTGSGNFSFLTNIGRFYRTFGLVRADSLRWIMLVKQDAGVGAEWTAFDSSWTAPTGLVRLQVVGKIDAKAPITLNGQTYNAYKATATRKVYLGGASTPSVVGETASIWLAPDLGIVKFIFNADGESNGFYRELKSKNF
jgi:hypothetical protein